MTLQTIIDELELLVRSRYALILLDTWDEQRVEEALRHVATRLSMHYHEWRRSKGIRRGTGSAGEPYANDTAAPVEALQHIEREGSGIFHLPGMARFFDDPVVAAHVHDVLDRFATRRGALVISGGEFQLPDSLRAHATVLRFPAPDADELRALFERIVRDHAARMPVRIELSNEERARLLNNLAGLSLTEAQRILTRLIMVDGALTAADIPRAAADKRKAIEQDGLMEYWATTDTLADIAGLDGLKAWLARRRAAVEHPNEAGAYGLPFPKGILLMGVPGCGKSSCAKAVSGEWKLPLLRLDPSTLYNKYIGDSEKNFKRAMATAERLAPVVLWIDEIEKAFAAGGGEADGGVSRRIFGTFLSWLQERKGDVFVVATSNDVSQLPPEFIRKGRFDEVFFVDLPDPAARRTLFEIHLKRRRQDPARLDLQRLVQASEGFSGAEVEQAIVSGLYAAFSSGASLTTQLLLDELGATHPLSRAMRERLDALRSWAKDRTVDASSPPRTRKLGAA